MKKKNRTLGANPTQITPNTGSTEVKWAVTFFTAHSQGTVNITQAAGPCTGLAASPSTMDFNGLSGTSAYTVTYNGSAITAYTVSASDSSWIIANNNNKGNIIVSANTGTTMKNGAVLMTYTENTAKTATITITQSGSVLTIDQISTFAATGETKNYIVRYNNVITTDYIATITGDGFTGSKGTITAASNSSSSQRNGTLIITSTTITTLTASTTIQQYGNTVSHTLSITTNNNINATEQTNIAYTVLYDGNQTTNYTPKIEGTGFSLGSQGYFNVSANPSSLSRNGILSVTSTTDASLIANTTITQSAKYVVNTTTDSLTISPNPLEFVYTGGTKNYTIFENQTVYWSDNTTTTQTVNITDNPYVTINLVDNYFKSTTIGTISALNNTTSVIKTAIATITYNNVNVQLSLSLAASPESYLFRVEPRNMTFSYSGGQQTFNAYLNEGLISSTAYTTQFTAGTAFNCNNGTVSVGKNYTDYERTATLRVIPNAFTSIYDEITMNQPANNLTIDPTLMEFSAEGGTKGYTVKYNGNVLTSSDYTIISFVGDTNYIESLTEEIRALANNTGNNKTAKLTVGYNNLSVYMEIILSGGTTPSPYWVTTLTPTPSTMNFVATGESIGYILFYEARQYLDSTLLSSITMYVTATSSSLEVTGLNDFVISDKEITAHYNTGDARSNKAILQYNGGPTCTISLIQAKGTTEHVLSVTPTIMNFTKTGGDIDFSVYYDGNYLEVGTYTQEISGDTSDTTISLVTEGVHAGINNSGKVRNATVTIKYNGLEVTITITQAMV